MPKICIQAKDGFILMKWLLQTRKTTLPILVFELYALAENLVQAIFPEPYELRHDKSNKMDVHPAKTQISKGIRPV